MLVERIQRVHERIQQACQRCGRSLASVTLVAVTKGFSVDIIREAVALKMTDIGENRVQETRQKRALLDADANRVRWHLIGHLQRNKARLAVELFDVIHSVDSEALVEELELQAAKKRRDEGQVTRDMIRNPLELFIQVNISGEATKSGCKPREALELARCVTQQPHLKLCGLMTMAPFSEHPEESRPVFRGLRVLRDELQKCLRASSHVSCPPSLLLSMGMSNDFEVAIEEGADLVRVGTAIFGT